MKFLDFNKNGQYDWWEYLIAVLIIIVIEVLAEVIARFLIP